MSDPAVHDPAASPASDDASAVRSSPDAAPLTDEAQAVVAALPDTIARLYGEPLTEIPKDLYIPPDALEVILETFEGPLDLLLYLIRRQNFNILDIPMAEVTRQYLSYVEEIRSRNLELAADYLLMAAMLIEIKSRMLLPVRPKEGEDDVEDPRAELVRRLLEYEQMKIAARQIDAFPQLGRDVLTAQVYVDQTMAPRLPDVNPDDLRAAWSDILRRAKLTAHHHISREPLSVREHMSRILKFLQGRPFVEFTELFMEELAHGGGVPIVVVHFLALLELAREGLVEVTQAEAYAPHLRSPRLYAVVNLHDRNTLGLPARADQVIAVTDVDQLPELSHTLHDHARCILGGGSNVVLHAPIPAAVLCNQLRGKNMSPTGLLTAASGEPWHDLVMWSLDQGFAGLENLALIPGTVGGAPVQNIGAYGVEISRCIVDVHAWDFHAQRHVVLPNEDCQFSYRHSIFKMPTVQGPWNAPRYFITQVSFQLAPISSAVLHTDYHELHEALQQSDARPPYSARDVAQAVIAIRQRKLPDPQTLGNVGSFFKNPVIGQVQAKHLTLLHPDLPHYPADDGRDDAVKISAAWLIERCGFKGARRGDVGVYSGHALVLVNHGGGTGREILALAQEIQQAVVARFGVFLEPEPVFLPAIG